MVLRWRWVALKGGVGYSILKLGEVEMMIGMGRRGEFLMKEELLLGLLFL
jgi:hypothetical protein